MFSFSFLLLGQDLTFCLSTTCTFAHIMVGGEIATTLLVLFEKAKNAPIDAWTCLRMGPRMSLCVPFCKPPVTCTMQSHVAIYLVYAKLSAGYAYLCVIVSWKKIKRSAYSTFERIVMHGFFLGISFI